MPDESNPVHDNLNTDRILREVRPMAGSVGDVLIGLKDVIRSEIHLAKTEAKQSAQVVGRSAIQIGVFGLFAALGLLPFIGFLVIGLGELLGFNYWLSSLIVSLVCFGVGGLLAYLAWRRIARSDLTLPATRRSVDQGLARVSRIERSSQRL